MFYSRFRYYCPSTGTFISQDPIGLAGNNPNLYAYVSDSNRMVDVFGLDPLGTSGYSVYGLYEKGSNVPYYIGITKQNINVRMSQHIETGRYIGTHAILKDNITIEQVRGGNRLI